MKKPFLAVVVAVTASRSRWSRRALRSGRLEQRRHAAVVIVRAPVLQGLRQAAVPHRDRPAAAGRGPCAAARDAAGGPVRSREAVQVQGREVFTVGYQGCDDSTAQTGAWDPAKCSSNARAYASEKTLHRRARHVQLRLREARGADPQPGAGRTLAMLSSANTNVGLTHYAPWNSPGEPGIYYPTGMRNYARVAATDDYQGPAAVTCSRARRSSWPRARSSRRSRASSSSTTTRRSGRAWLRPSRPRRTDPRHQGARLRAVGREGNELRGHRPADQASGAQSVYLGGIVCNNGVKLLKDLRAALGPEWCSSRPDGWTPYSATLGAGAAAQGMYISYAGQPLEKLGKTGKAFIAAFRKYAHIKGNMPPYSVYQAQSAQIMLNAIARRTARVQSVIKQMFKTRVKNGIMGTFHFDKNGDTLPVQVDQLRPVSRGQTRARTPCTRSSRRSSG